MESGTRSRDPGAGVLGSGLETGKQREVQIVRGLERSKGSMACNKGCRKGHMAYIALARSMVNGCTWMSNLRA